GQIAIAWLLAKGPEFGIDIVPIPGTKRRTYLEENVAAADIGLDATEMLLLDMALTPDRISGPRYNERTMSMVDR
ncbi:MAG: aldo/keto reductase, partial [Mesorhizobium sp.]